MRSDPRAYCENAAAEVKRVARVSVRASGSENFLLVEKASGIGTCGQTNRADDGAERERGSRRAGKDQDDGRKHIPNADAPALKEVWAGHGSGTHILPMGHVPDLAPAEFMNVLLGVA